MANRPNMKKDYESTKVNKKDDALNNTSQKEKNTSKTKYPRQTYYIPTELKRAIDMMAVIEGKEKSEVVRELLYKAIDPMYFKDPKFK